MAAGAKVSIIIPCYNAEAFVLEALESAGAQTYRPIEIICVNDGSTDASLEKIQAFEQSFSGNMKVIFTANKGGASARNEGLRAAEGEYIQFLDADDVLLPEKLQHQVQHQKQTAADVVFSDYQIFSTDLNKLKEIRRFSDFNLNPLRAGVTRVISTQNPIYSRKVLQEFGGYDEALTCAQDWELNLRLILDGVKYAHLPGFYSKVRQVKGSVSSNWVQVSEVQTEILSKNLARIQADTRYSKSIRREIKQIYFNTLLHRKRSPESDDLFVQLSRWGGGSLSYIPGLLKRTAASLIGVPKLIRILRNIKGR